MAALARKVDWVDFSSYALAAPAKVDRRKSVAREAAGREESAVEYRFGAPAVGGDRR
jgi:hypothetical protein